MTGNLALTLACGDYDRTRGLHDGSVRCEGIALNTVALEPEEIFFRMVRFQEFEVAELSLSTYVLTMNAAGGSPFVAIPVFPSRSFRHSGIYVAKGNGIESPTDLIGRTVGVAEYQLTANVWIRGILEDHYGVAAPSVRYRTGGLHDAGRQEKVALALPAEIDIAPIDAQTTLSELLLAGEIDAIYSPRTPEAFERGDSRIARLFPDHRLVEADYFAQTGVFPIMHVVVVRRDVYEQHRWVARSLTKAFDAARRQALAGIDATTALRFTLPWLVAEVERTRAIMGTDFWTYGLDPGNVAALSTFLRYSRSQGLAEADLQPPELFAPETHDAVLI